MPFSEYLTKYEVEVSSLSTPIFFENGAASSRCFEVKVFLPGKKRKMEKCADFEIMVGLWRISADALKPCGRGRKKTENFGRLCRQMARERREKSFSMENSGGRYSLHNLRFEGELAKNKKNDIERSMPELSKVLVVAGRLELSTSSV